MLRDSQGTAAAFFFYFLHNDRMTYFCKVLLMRVILFEIKDIIPDDPFSMIVCVILADLISMLFFGEKFATL